MAQRIARRTAFRLALAAALVSAAVLAGACGPKKVVVEARNTRFYPEEITVKVGTTVIWINQDPMAHSVVEGDWNHKGHYTPLFRSGDFTTGKTFSHTFAKEGTYLYFCDTGGHYLLGMVGKVIVTR